MEKTVQILLAEDDFNLGSLLKQYLEAKEYSVELAEDGVLALEKFQRKEFDICIFDVMMPRKDGFTLAGEVKEIKRDIPIIFLTAKTLKDDVLQGFKIGADDYITKPFNMEELLMRIEAVLRRSGVMENQEVNEYQIGKFKFEIQKQTLTIDGQEPIKLTTKESGLLRLLCLNKNRMLERNYALKQIWEDDNYFNARSMDVYITKLRKHLKDDPDVEILNIHGRGYKLIISSEE